MFQCYKFYCIFIARPNIIRIRFDQNKLFSHKFPFSSKIKSEDLKEVTNRVCNLNPKIGLTRTGLGFSGFFRVKALKIISISGRVGFKLYKKVWVISTRVIERKKPLGFFGFFRVEKLKTQFIFCHNLLFLTQ